MGKEKEKEKEYVYIVGIDEGAKECSLILVKQTEDEKIVVLEERGEKAALWLDFFYELNGGQAKVVVDKE